MTQTQSRTAFLVILVSFFVAGCSGTGEATPELTPVSGRVTLNGKPLPDAIVTFIPTAGRLSIGTTDAAGNYELFHKPGEPGAISGEHTVKITVEENMTVPLDWQVVIPEKYNTSSTLKVTLSGSQAVTHNFDLEGPGK